MLERSNKIVLHFHIIDGIYVIYIQAPLKKIPNDKLVPKEEEFEEEKPEKEELDWWSKYYESLKELNKQVIMDPTV